MTAVAAPKKAAAKKASGKKAPAKKQASNKGQKKDSVKKSGKNQNKKEAKVSGQVDEDFEIDGMERYTGECVYFNRTGGFGFIRLATEGVVPEDKIMVHWSQIQSDDRWPFLHKGLAVEFNLDKIKREGKWQVRAKSVSNLGGEPISLQDEIDDKREFVGERSLRFLGNVKFYDFNQGFGYVRLQDGYDIDDAVPQEFRIDRAEIATGEDGTLARLRPGMEIEFGIFKTKKGNYACYHVTMPGGDAITREVVEGRENVTTNTFTGEITMWAFQKGFGWIQPDDVAGLPKNIKDALAEDGKKRNEKAKKKGKDEVTGAIYVRTGDKVDRTERLAKGDKVKFNIYTDSQGVGACNVTKA